MIAVLIGAPTLTVAARWLEPGEVAAAGPAPATPGVPDIIDLTDGLTLAALPTALLVRLEVTPQNRVVLHLPRAEVGQGITTATAMIVAEEMDSVARPG